MADEAERQIDRIRLQDLRDSHRIDGRATQSPLDTTPSGIAKRNAQQAAAGIAGTQGSPPASGNLAPDTSREAGAWHGPHSWEAGAMTGAGPRPAIDPRIVGSSGVRSGNQIISPYGSASVRGAFNPGDIASPNFNLQTGVTPPSLFGQSMTLGEQPRLADSGFGFGAGMPSLPPTVSPTPPPVTPPPATPRPSVTPTPPRITGRGAPPQDPDISDPYWRMKEEAKSWGNAIKGFVPTNPFLAVQ